VPNFVEEIIARLTQAQVEFVVVGGMSAVLQGVPIVTRDLDLCYHRTPVNISRLATALAPFKPRLRGLPPDLPSLFDEHYLQQGTNVTLLLGNEEVDLLAEMSGIGGYEQIIGQAEEMTVGATVVKVLSLVQLIATKEAAARAKDLAVVPLLKATLEFKQQQDLPPHEPPANP
jgi:hypothetical protein